MDWLECHRWLTALVAPARRPTRDVPALLAQEERLREAVDWSLDALLAGRPVPLPRAQPLLPYLWNQRLFAALPLVRAAGVPGSPVRVRDWSPHRRWLLVDWWRAAGREEWALAEEIRWQDRLDHGV